MMRDPTCMASYILYTMLIACKIRFMVGTHITCLGNCRIPRIQGLMIWGTRYYSSDRVRKINYPSADTTVYLHW